MLIHFYAKDIKFFLTCYFIKKYHPDADYFELEVVTVCKTKTMDGWKEKTEDGKTLNHPERGQLNL